MPPVLAQGSTPENSPTAASGPGSAFDGLKRTGSGRVDRVIDGLTILMKDGKIIRLAGIDIPGYGREDSDIPLLAFQVLQKLAPENTELVLYQTRSAKAGRENRMGQHLAHIYSEKDNVWLQGGLLAIGLARAMSSAANPEMIAEMLQQESLARKAGEGIWAKDSPYRLFGPDELANKIGTVQVVEGRIEKAASVRNNLYLNFGKDWKTDFTVRMDTGLRKELSRQGIDPVALSGRRVRVRGYIEEYNGPMITLETIHHLEILDRP